VDWCSRRKEDSDNPSVALLANYLAYLFEEGLSANCLAIHKSAISSILSVEDSRFEFLSQAPLLKRLIKGVFNCSGSQKVKVTWDVSLVLNLLRSWGPNRVLDEKQLLLKCITLLALVSACRVGELASLSRNIQEMPSGWILNLIKLKKNSSVKRANLELNIFFLS
jgi:hypothetical protein